MARDEPLLEVRNLSVAFETRSGVVNAVSDVSFSISAGESFGIVGESGCGKSTVAYAILRYLGRNGRIAGGEVLFKGQELRTLDRRALRRLWGREIAMVYQEPMAALNPSIRVGAQLAEVAGLARPQSDRHQALHEARAILENVRIADSDRVMSAYPHQLSGGQQQRVVIAMALLAQPALLILDEPTTALDVTVEAGIVDLIRDISARQGTSLLFISHNLGLIHETCERVAVMYAGEIVEEGPVETVFDAMRHPYTRGLFRAIPLPYEGRSGRHLEAIPGSPPSPHERPSGCIFRTRCDFAIDGRCDRSPIPLDVVDAAQNHRSRCVRWREIDWEERAPVRSDRATRHFGAPIVTARHIFKDYPVRDDRLRAVLSGKRVRPLVANRDISFELRRGETIALVGESGCGKSTTAKLVTGLETASDGRIDLMGHDVEAVPVDRRPGKLVRALQMIFQNPNDTLNPSQSVGRQMRRAVHKLKPELDRTAVDRHAVELLELVQLTADYIDRLPRQLSGGQKQRVAIARALAGDPEILVADEPLSALDVSVQAAVSDLLLRIQENAGSALLFISHDLGVVRYLADQILVMYLGEMMEQGATEKIFRPPYHPYTEALLSAVPLPDPNVERTRIVLEGPVPSPLDRPKGCPFATRCPRKVGEICDTTPPPAREAGPGHIIRCHIALEELRTVAPVFRPRESR